MNFLWLRLDTHLCENITAAHAAVATVRKAAVPSRTRGEFSFAFLHSNNSVLFITLLWFES